MRTQLTFSREGLETLDNPVHVVVCRGRGRGGSIVVYADAGDGAFAVDYQSGGGVVVLTQGLSEKLRYPEGTLTMKPYNQDKQKYTSYGNGVAFTLKQGEDKGEVTATTITDDVENGSVSDFLDGNESSFTENGFNGDTDDEHYMLATEGVSEPYLGEDEGEDEGEGNAAADDEHYTLATEGVSEPYLEEDEGEGNAAAVA